jgi:signal peptidase I
MSARILVHTTILTLLLGVWYWIPWRLCRVEGHSMEPTLRAGQWILVERHHYRTHRPRRGEVVLFNHEGALYVKRVAATAGETVLLLAEGPPWPGNVLRVVDRGEEARVRSLTRVCARLRLVRARIPGGCFFALGDGGGCSLDSCDLGPIRESALIGRARPLGAWACRPAESIRRVPPRRPH